MIDKSNEQLVCDAKNGNEYAVNLLVERMMPIIVKSANIYNEPLYDKEDLIQEGRVAVFNAINSYNSSKNASFKTFANVCITNRLLNVIKKKSSKQIISRNEIIALSDDSINFTIQNDSNTQSPDNAIIENETYALINTALKKVLSPLEHRVLDLYLNDYSYEDIATELSQPIKSIDNALQRARKKLRYFLK